MTPPPGDITQTSGDCFEGFSYKRPFAYIRDEKQTERINGCDAYLTQIKLLIGLYGQNMHCYNYAFGLFFVPVQRTAFTLKYIPCLSVGAGFPRVSL
jgi:hypothetical protein